MSVLPVCCILGDSLTEPARYPDKNVGRYIRLVAGRERWSDLKQHSVSRL